MAVGVSPATSALPLDVPRQGQVASKIDMLLRYENLGNRPIEYNKQPAADKTSIAFVGADNVPTTRERLRCGDGVCYLWLGASCLCVADDLAQYVDGS